MTNQAPEELLNALTPKQRMFVEAYLSNDYNASQAIKSAGYKTTNLRQMGHEMLQKPHVKAAIDAALEQRAEQFRVKPEYVLRKIKSTVERSEMEGNHNATLRGLELLARHLGMFIDRQEITGKDGEAIKYEEIKNEAADFARSISRLADRARKGENSLRAVGGSES